MALTHEKVIKDRIKSAFNPVYYRYLYQQMLFQLGQDVGLGQRDGDDTWGDGIKYFRNIDIETITLGASRKPLNATYIMQGRVMGQMPEPSFPQLDTFTGEVRKQYCITRPNQHYGLGEWYPHLVGCFNDADSLGYAGVQVGQRTDPMDKVRTVMVQHLPPTQILYDPTVPHPSMSRWVAVIHYLTPDDVRSQYRKPKIVDNARRVGYETIAGQQWDIVRVIEYFDLGYGKGEPTYSVMIGSLDSDESMVMRQHNAREDISVAFMVNFVAPGMNRPIGRICMQHQTTKMINLMEEHMFKEWSMSPSIDLIDIDAIHPDDWQRHLEGKGPGYMRAQKRLDGQVWVRIKREGVDRMLFEMMGYYNRQETEDVGLSEMDRGLAPETVRSAQEIATIQSKSQASQGWIPREAARFMRRFYARLVRAARDEDDKKITLDVRGQNIPLNFNDERYPNLTVEAFMTEDSAVVIDTQALTGDDDALKRNERLQFLERLLQTGVVGQVVDTGWWTEQYLRAGGRDDAKIAMGQAGQANAASGIDPAALQVAQTGQASTLPIGA